MPFFQSFIRKIGQITKAANINTKTEFETALMELDIEERNGFYYLKHSDLHKLLISKQYINSEIEKNYSKFFVNLDKQMEANSDVLNEEQTLITMNRLVDNVPNTQIEEIFSQIDLAQARITKAQEEINSLAKETDDLLNQLEYKAS